MNAQSEPPIGCLSTGRDEALSLRDLHGGRIVHTWNELTVCPDPGDPVSLSDGQG